MRLTLAKLAITAAVANQIGPPAAAQLLDAPRSALLQATFNYGSGGTTVDAWVQTSVDGGATWIDVANFHFTTASARYLFNLSSLTPVTTEATPTDGTLAANTSKDGFLGPLWRVKTTSTGTYAGGTTLQIDASLPDR